MCYNTYFFGFNNAFQKANIAKLGIKLLIFSFYC